MQQFTSNGDFINDIKVSNLRCFGINCQLIQNDMVLVNNKFINYEINKQTEILILGTFSHDIVDGADFFYGKPRNYLWHLLPICFKQASLKESPLEHKIDFMKTHQIDFADIIDTIQVPEGEENNLDDTFIDNHAHSWKDITLLISNLPNIKGVYFTRKTFNGIPNCKAQIVKIANFCATNNIRFCKLETPAKYYDDTKQNQWIDTLVKLKTCMKV